jgi:hypothetical protein
VLITAGSFIGRGADGFEQGEQFQPAVKQGWAATAFGQEAAGYRALTAAQLYDHLLCVRFGVHAGDGTGGGR